MEEVKISQLTTKELNNSEIKNWPVWEKEISEFDWFYSDTEQCYIL